MTNNPTESNKAIAWLWENFKILLIALCITFIMKTFLWQPFHIPSGSMKPGLLEGDYIFVNKIAYGYSNYSLPFRPSFILDKERIFYTAPKRGDVIVFSPRLIKDPDKSFYIKRLIGLPGDVIEIKNQHLYINGQLVQDQRYGDFIDYVKGVGSIELEKFIESLPDIDKKYEVLYLQERPSMEYAKFSVPADQFFVMGDNRDNSIDSRYMDELGFVPKQNLVGKAVCVFFSIDRGQISWQNFYKMFRLERMFKKIA